MGEDEVRAFAGGDGARYVANTHGISAVQGDGVEGLDGGKAHADAGEGHYKAHVTGGGGAGVVVRGQGDAKAGVDELLGASEGDTQEEGRAGKHRGHRLGVFQCVDFRIGRSLQMVHGQGVVLHAHLHAAADGEFVGMDLRA